MVDPRDAQVKVGIQRGMPLAGMIDQPSQDGIANLHMRHVQRITEREALHLRGEASQRHAIDRAGVDIIDEPGIRAEAGDIGGAFQDGGQVTQGAHDATGTNGIAAAHTHSITRANLTIQAAITHRINREAEHDEIRARQRIFPVVMRLDF